MDDNKVFQEVDLFSILEEIGSMNKTLNAKVLTELEKHIKDKDEFTTVRKFILDEQNSYTRSVVRAIFGDIEFMNFPRK